MYKNHLSYLGIDLLQIRVHEHAEKQTGPLLVIMQGASCWIQRCSLGSKDPLVCVKVDQGESEEGRMVTLVSIWQ